MQQGTNAPQGRGELIGVVGGRIFELLEQRVDRGACFGGVSGFGVFAVGNVQRIEGHDRLFRGAFIGNGEVLRVVGDTLEHAQRNGLVILHGGEALRDALRQRRGSRSGLRHDAAIRVQLAHFRGHRIKRGVAL